MWGGPPGPRRTSRSGSCGTSSSRAGKRWITREENILVRGAANMKNTELVVLKTFPNVIAAEMAKTTLDAAEIDSFLRSDDSGHLDPALSLTNGVKLLVRAA